MKIQLSYQTQEIPAPYAFAACILLTIVDDSVHLSYQMEYLGREDLSEEEITRLGFSTSDDFEWEGELGDSWSTSLKAFNSTITYKSRPSGLGYLHVVVDGVERGYPVDDQELLIQELIQAVFESARRERPLSIQLLDEEKVATTLKWNFNQRKFTVDGHTCDWNVGRKIMNLLYSLEFEDHLSSDAPAPYSVHYQGNKEWLKITDNAMIEALSSTLYEVKNT